MSKAHYREATACRIQKAIRDHGQLHKTGLCEAMSCSYTAIDATVAEMRRRGELIVLGTAKDAGYTDVHSHSPVYGLPGMTLQKVASTVKPKTESGSGQIAQPNRGFEFRPLVRDPFEHMRLALAGR